LIDAPCGRSRARRTDLQALKGNEMTDRYDARSALDELNEDAVLPHPVRLRDMILRQQLGADDALSLNREFQDYLAAFGQSQEIAREILQKLATGHPKAL
jgi:hypothetical protein